MVDNMSPPGKSSRSKKTALLILDMLSEFEFPDGESVKRAAERIASPIAKLRVRVRRKSAPVIYVNDTSGEWESDQAAFIQRCLEGRGAKIAELLRPTQDEHFMFKPRHSAFYGTPLAELLYALDVTHLVLSGVSSHQCVLLTASDAHIRNLDVTIAVDCIAAPQAAATRHAIYILEQGLQARIAQSRSIRF
jgi:nicotinamidase-related amidase